MHKQADQVFDSLLSKYSALMERSFSDHLPEEIDFTKTAAQIVAPDPALESRFEAALLLDTLLNKRAA